MKTEIKKYGAEVESLEKIKKRLFKGILLEVDKGHFNTSITAKMKKRGKELLFTGMLPSRVVNEMGLKKGDNVYILVEPKTESFTIFKLP